MMKVCSSAAGGGWRLLTLHANQRSLIRLFLYAWQTTDNILTQRQTERDRHTQYAFLIHYKLIRWNKKANL